MFDHWLGLYGYQCHVHLMSSEIICSTTAKKPNFVKVIAIWEYYTRIFQQVLLPLSSSALVHSSFYSGVEFMSKVYIGYKPCLFHIFSQNGAVMGILKITWIPLSYSFASIVFF